MEIENDKKLLQWFNNSEIAKSTRISYLGFMRIFCECLRLSPTELIEESIKEIKAGKMPAERKIGGQIAKYKQCLKERGYAPKSFHIGISAVSSFYKSFDIPLPNGVIKTKKAMPLKVNNNFLSKEDIVKLLTNAPNLREKAIILCMATSGMARNEIINLKVKDITLDDEGISALSIRREKVQVDYVTFISPEATQALKVYWEERDRLAAGKESITVEELKKSKFANADETFTNRKLFASKLKVKPESYAFVTYETGDKLSKSHFAGIFHSMAEKLGYADGEGYIKTRSHGLRKFFASTLEDNGFPKAKIDFMLGHTPSGNDFAYFHRNISLLKELYKLHLPYLTFEKTIEVRSLNTQDSKRLEELDKENKELKTRLIKIESEKEKDTKLITEFMDLMKKEPRLLDILKGASKLGEKES